MTSNHLARGTVNANGEIHGFCALAGRYPFIAQSIFDTKEKRFLPHIVARYKDRVISPYIVDEQVQHDGDRITILPVYTGG